MSETRTLRGEVVHVVPADEQEDYDLTAALSGLSESKHILVLREGGPPSLVEKVRAFFGRSPIEAVTLVADVAPEEGAVVEAVVRETEIAGVYVAEGAVEVS